MRGSGVGAAGGGEGAGNVWKSRLGALMLLTLGYQVRRGGEVLRGGGGVGV